MIRLIVALAIMSIGTAVASGPSHGKIVMCRLDSVPYNLIIIESQTDLNTCTHLNIYGSSYSDLKRAPWETLSYSVYLGLNELRSNYPHLKILLSIDQNLTPYCNLAPKERARTAYIWKAFNFLEKFKFDGLHINLNATKLCTDKKVLTPLVREFSKKFEEKQLLLGLTINTWTGDLRVMEVFDYPAISEYSVFIHFQITFSYNPVRDLECSLNFYTCKKLLYAAEQLINSSISSERILMDISFSGLELDVDKNSKAISATERGNDFICREISDFHNSNYNKTYYSESGAGVAIHTQKDRVFMYDSSRVIANKIRFVMRNNLGGAFISSPISDDREGKCEFDDDTYDDYNSISGVELNIPIRLNKEFYFIKFVNESIYVALDEIEQEKILGKSDSIDLVSES